MRLNRTIHAGGNGERETRQRLLDAAGAVFADRRDRIATGQGIRPRARALESIVRELIGSGAGSAEIRLCAMSVVAQCLFYQHCRAVITRLYPDFRYDSATIERLAEHITRFSLNALRPRRRKAKGRRS